VFFFSPVWAQASLRAQRRRGCHLSSDGVTAALDQPGAAGVNKETNKQTKRGGPDENNQDARWEQGEERRVKEAGGEEGGEGIADRKQNTMTLKKKRTTE